MKFRIVNDSFLKMIYIELDWKGNWIIAVKIIESEIWFKTKLNENKIINYLILKLKLKI